MDVDQASASGRRIRWRLGHQVLTVVFASVFTWFLRLICASNRLTVTRGDLVSEYLGRGGNIFAFWHSKLFYLAYYYGKHARGHKVAMLVSLSRDGDYGEAVVRKLRQEVVRGSSSRGGRRAVLGLVRRLAAGENVAITPDGPRGPAFRVNEGTIKLAQITGARIIPVSFDASRKRRLRSWDQFIAVKPFGRVHVAFGEPMEIPRGIPTIDRERYREQLEERLRELDCICTTSLSGHEQSRSKCSQQSPG